MKTNHTNTLIATPDFPGIVIDPQTGRKCALQIDIFRGLGLAGEQVTKTKARVYQNRFFDVEDVVAARAKVRPQGSRRPRGIILLEMISTVVSVCVGITVAAGVVADGAKSMSYTPPHAGGSQQTVKLDWEINCAVVCLTPRELRNACSTDGIVSIQNLNPKITLP